MVAEKVQSPVRLAISFNRRTVVLKILIPSEDCCESLLGNLTHSSGRMLQTGKLVNS